MLAVAVGCAVLGGGLAVRYLFVTSPDQAAVNAAPRISDTAFERAAAAVCSRYVHVFDTGTTLGNQPSQAQSGRFLTTIADTFDAMVVELKALPVAAADRPAVDHWLGQWDTYDAFGHQYAAAVAKGQERDLVARDSASQGTLRRERNAFAEANHMRSCAFS
ncbi:MAG TPA: hypothetical protein VGI06_13930 [Acidimicrobiales bacterium]